MLEALSHEKVLRVIELAQLHERGRDDLLVLLSDMSKAEVAELMAVMWRGRGDDPGESWAESVQYAHEHSDEGDLHYIAGKTPLPGYLIKGLKALGY